MTATLDCREGCYWENEAGKEALAGNEAGKEAKIFISHALHFSHKCE